MPYPEGPPIRKEVHQNDFEIPDWVNQGSTLDFEELEFGDLWNELSTNRQRALKIFGSAVTTFAGFTMIYYDVMNDGVLSAVSGSIGSPTVFGSTVYGMWHGCILLADKMADFTSQDRKHG
ncbi:MAG: hypothetical protein U5L95_01015 [Candidatus Saccharibacteria bacterium]|nr:hypothetical protein [Candidatus Saccharibacteria bacterium]